MCMVEGQGMDSPAASPPDPVVSPDSHSVLQVCDSAVLPEQRDWGRRNSLSYS